MKEIPLTEEQREQFKQLYNEGYSSTQIFKKLGFNIDIWLARGRMIYYRKALGLDPRFRGWKSPVQTAEQKEKANKKMLNEVRKCNDAVHYYEEKLEQARQRWKKVGILLATLKPPDKQPV